MFHLQINTNLDPNELVTILKVLSCTAPKKEELGPVVQSIVRLMTSLVVKMLTVLVSTISNSQLFLLKKCE